MSLIMFCMWSSLLAPLLKVTLLCPKKLTWLYNAWGVWHIYWSVGIKLGHDYLWYRFERNNLFECAVVSRGIARGFVLEFGFGVKVSLWSSLFKAIVQWLTGVCQMTVHPLDGIKAFWQGSLSRVCAYVCCWLKYMVPRWIQTLYEAFCSLLLICVCFL